MFNDAFSLNKLSRKIFRYWGGVSKNLKIGKLFLILAISHFSRLFVNKSDLSLSYFEVKTFIRKDLPQKKKKKEALLREKNRLIFKM